MANSWGRTGKAGLPEKERDRTLEKRQVKEDLKSETGEFPIGKPAPNLTLFSSQSKATQWPQCLAELSSEMWGNKKHFRSPAASQALFRDQLTKTKLSHFLTPHTAPSVSSYPSGVTCSHKLTYATKYTTLCSLFNDFVLCKKFWCRSSIYIIKEDQAWWHLQGQTDLGSQLGLFSEIQDSQD